MEENKNQSEDTSLNLEESNNSDVEMVNVTSLAEEAEKTGQPIELTPEQAINLAAQQHTAGLRYFKEALRKVSVRGLRRVVLGLLQLPDLDGSGKMPSFLNKQEDKDLFSLGQTVLTAKYGLLFEHVQRKKQEAILKKQAEAVKNEEVTEVKNEETTTEETTTEETKAEEASSS